MISYKDKTYCSPVKPFSDAQCKAAGCDRILTTGVFSEADKVELSVAFGDLWVDPSICPIRRKEEEENTDG